MAGLHNSPYPQLKPFTTLYFGLSYNRYFSYRLLTDHTENTASQFAAYLEMFTEPLSRNGLHNPLRLLLRACILS
jgi:hypothetical protein